MKKRDGECQYAKLIRRYCDGDVHAREELIMENLDKAEHIASKYFGLGMDDEDLIQNAYEGLIRAIDRCLCSPTSNHSKYVSYAIDLAVRRALAEYRLFTNQTMPNRGTKVCILLAQRDLLKELGREPTADEIIERTGILESVVRRTLLDDRMRMNVSLDDPIWRKDIYLSTKLSDVEKEMLANESLERVREYMSDADLRPSERTVLNLMAECSTRTADLARELQCSDTYVSKIKFRLAKKLKKLMDEFREDGAFACDNDGEEVLSQERVFVHKRIKDRQYNKCKY